MFLILRTLVFGKRRDHAAMTVLRSRGAFTLLGEGRQRRNLDTFDSRAIPREERTSKC